MILLLAVVIVLLVLFGGGVRGGNANVGNLLWVVAVILLAYLIVSLLT